ncbi:MAG TPA: prolyl oligopeptidase family serine peptidase, partial [Gemmatimonadales bacterium]|nr:prolyl oligopeptidase family serine peptidase [Gemmatimonadales bacterium]
LPLTLQDASRNDRWLGLGVRDVRWSPDGSTIYFRWNRHPETNDLPDADPWFRAASDGSWAEEVPASERPFIPGDTTIWTGDSRLASWVDGASLFLFDPSAQPTIQRIVTLSAALRTPRFAEQGRAIYFEMGEELYRFEIATRTLALVAMRVNAATSGGTEAAKRLAAQQRELFPSITHADSVARATAAIGRTRFDLPQSIPVPAGTRIDGIQLSPDGRFVTFRALTTDSRRPPTRYVDYVDQSGYATVHEARGKAGEPRDRARLGVVRFAPHDPVDSATVKWVTLAEAKDQETEPYGPYWSLEGDRAVVQFIGEHDKDIWIAELDPATATVRVITADHESGWIGGPPIQSNYLGPALLEWLPGGKFAFASERSGWSHLYLAERSGSIRPLTEGNWEVRDASLSRDRTRWLLQTSQSHPSDDQLYLMPADGGQLMQLTGDPGRQSGILSPDGRQLAIVASTTTELPDLFLSTADKGAERKRVTVSGTDAFLRHRLVKPEIVSFPHPDGKPVWAALYRPARMNPERAAVIHVHGGGYRQFAHRGWSVYGWGLHVGFLHYLLEQGYPVLDFDYRGGAGFGRDYRTDVTGAMGGKDVDGAVAAARYLVKSVGADSTRIGIYGVSYGGFMTLMSQFRYPGIFAAGIARAPVTDWAHYSDEWTTRILGLPQRDTAAYRRSSPIYYAEGLRDHLLIEHGLVDDNVHFQ